MTDVEQPLDRGEQLFVPTPEQVRLINAQFDILLCFGAHGGPDPEVEEPSLLDGTVWNSTQLEYDAVATIIASLGEQDMVFREGYGYTIATQEPYLSTETRSEMEYSRIASTAGSLAVRGALEQIEKNRQAALFSAWSYAELLASAKGITCMNADRNYTQRQADRERSGGRKLEALNDSQEPEDMSLAREIHSLREIAACNTLVGWAVNNMDPDEVPGTNPLKSKLVLFFGSYHSQAITDALRSLGLNPRVTMLPQSDYASRLREYQSNKQRQEAKKISGK